MLDILDMLDTLDTDTPGSTPKPKFLASTPLTAMGTAAALPMHAHSHPGPFSLGPPQSPPP
jgi:hypothetical protein